MKIARKTESPTGRASFEVSFKLVSRPNATNLDNLPDYCLLVIFKRVSLQTQIGLRAVCLRWKALIETLICQPKKSLKLFSSFRDIYTYVGDVINLTLYDCEQFVLKPVGQDDDLIILKKHFGDGHFREFLSRLFPNVTFLVISVYRASNLAITQMSLMLQHWPNLVSLSIFSRTNEDLDNRTVTQLYQSINKLTSLKRLDIFANVFRTAQDITNGIPQILPQLEYLSLDSYCSDFKFKSVIAKLGSSLKGLRLDYCNVVLGNMPSSFTRTFSVLAKNITQLHLSKVRDNEVVGLVCGHLCQLKQLELVFYRNFRSIKLDNNFLVILSRLPRLIDLKLKCMDIIVDSNTTVCLPALKALDLNKLACEQTNGDDKTVCSTLVSMFPNLEKFTACLGHDVAPEVSNKEYFVDQFHHLLDCRVYLSCRELASMGRHKID